MRWIRSNGKRLEVREIGEVVYALQICEAGRNYPLPILDIIEDDPQARERLRSLLAMGLYERLRDE